MRITAVWAGWEWLAVAGRIATIVGCLVLEACVSLAPQELIQARTTYDRAARGGLAWRSPAALGLARRSLAAAEATFYDEGDTEMARDQAYIALRKAELAEVEASTRMLEQRMTTVRDREASPRVRDLQQSSHHD